MPRIVATEQVHVPFRADVDLSDATERCTQAPEQFRSDTEDSAGQTPDQVSMTDHNLNTFFPADRPEISGKHLVGAIDSISKLDIVRARDLAEELTSPHRNRGEPSRNDLCCFKRASYRAAMDDANIQRVKPPGREVCLPSPERRQARRTRVFFVGIHIELTVANQIQNPSAHRLDLHDNAFNNLG
jgi:hypothetical protein